MKYLKYILFVMIIFLVPNVYAQEFNVSRSDVTCPLTSGTGKYCGAEVYYTGTSAAYNLGTRYDGRLNRIWFNLIAGGYADSNGFEKGHTYTVSMNMSTNDWNNKFGSVSVKCEGSSGTELVKGGITYVSYKKIKFTFQAPSNDWCQFVYVDIRASSGNTITQVSNWNLSSLTISDSAYDSGSGGSGGSGTTTDPNQSIIDANNENTTQIIDNQNQNTSDIIDNINEASSTITNSFDTMLGNKCTNLFDFPFTSSEPFSINATQNDYALQTIYLINLDSSKTYNFSFKSNKPYGASENSDSVEAFFLKDGSYTTYFHLDGKSGTFTPPQTGIYVLRLDCNKSGETCTYYDFMISTETNIYCPFDTTSSKLDETNQGIKDLNDKLDGLGRVIEDSQVDDKSSFFTGFQDNSHGLTGIITAPLTTIQGLANKSCVPLSIPIPFTNSNVDLPCMTQVYQTYVPTVFNLWQVVSFGIISYFICIDIFKMVKGFKDPNEDKVEVLDL